MLLLGVLVVVGILAVYVVLSSMSPPPTSTTLTTANAPRSWSEGQLFVTTGIVSSGNQVYILETTLRSVTTSLVVSIQATVNYSRTVSQSVAFFFAGMSLISSTVPLGFNVTANAEVTNLAPPAPLQMGQVLPETLSVTFQNGTSVELHLTAQVYSP